MLSPQIAILIPYFNEKELLTECLQSLLEQNVPVNEIIIYDDNSRWPAAQYIPESMNVKLIQGKINRGQGFARNELLKLARSNYVHFHDADDVFLPEWHAKILVKLTKNEVDIIFSNANILKEHKIISETAISLNIKRLKNNVPMINVILRGAIVPSCFTIKKSLALKMGGFRLRDQYPTSEDFDFLLRAAILPVTYQTLDEALVLQRWRANSSSRNINNEHRVENTLYQVKSIRQNEIRLLPKHQEVTKRRLAFIAKELFRVGYYLDSFKTIQYAKRMGPIKFYNKSNAFQKWSKHIGPFATLCLEKLYPPLRDSKG
jgi:glycosyltransferase involved in cell wall biosynthesis